MEFEKFKKNNFLTDLPIPEKQGRVRGNKNIFKVGLVGCSGVRRFDSRVWHIFHQLSETGERMITEHCLTA